MAHRTGWQRAAVLGANDGLVSTASLVVGVAAAGSGRPGILIDGLVAGPMSMTAGEFVSVSLQTNADQAEIARETGDLKETPEADLDELTRIHRTRARRWSRPPSRDALTDKDALGTHSRDELGLSETVTAHPIQTLVAGMQIIQLA